MKPALIAMALLLCGVTHVEARCYARWYYPWPQNLTERHRGHSRPVVAIRERPRVPSVDDVVPTVPDIPLPDMSATWGGAMDTELELSMSRQRAIRQLTQEGN